jgi:hypothetical protein
MRIARRQLGEILVTSNHLVGRSFPHREVWSHRNSEDIDAYQHSIPKGPLETSAQQA